MARGTTFTDKIALEEMLVLRMAGATYNDLGRRYEVDHTTIIYHCKKAGIGTPELEPVKLKRKERIIVPKQIVQRREIRLHPILAAERMNTGKTYAEYVEAQHQRRYAHLKGFLPMPKNATIRYE